MSLLGIMFFKIFMQNLINCIHFRQDLEYCTDSSIVNKIIFVIKSWTKPAELSSLNKVFFGRGNFKVKD